MPIQFYYESNRETPNIDSQQSICILILYFNYNILNVNILQYKAIKCVRQGNTLNIIINLNFFFISKLHVHVVVSWIPLDLTFSLMWLMHGCSTLLKSQNTFARLVLKLIHFLRSYLSSTNVSKKIIFKNPFPLILYNDFNCLIFFMHIRGTRVSGLHTFFYNSYRDRINVCTFLSYQKISSLF